MKTMSALQVSQPRHFDCLHVPIPDLDKAGPGNILVQPAWLSLCGSDIPFFTGSKRYRPYPLPPGAPIHEASGVVVASLSERFNPGQRVVAIPESDLGLAEYFLARDTKAVRLPDELDDHGSACLVQPLSTVLNALDRLGDVAGRSVAVIGLGSIGLFFCWLLKQRGAQKIIGIDPCTWRCRAAEELGVERTYSQRSIELVHASQKPGSGWQAPDVCIEAVGHQMDTLNNCLDLVRKDGTVLAFGVPDHPVYAVEYETFFRKNLHLLGVVTPDWSEYLPNARDLFLENKPVLERLVTHRLPIRQAGEVFSLYETHSDNILKALLDATAW